jgi:hypothetical protein
VDIITDRASQTADTSTGVARASSYCLPRPLITSAAAFTWVMIEEASPP